MLLTSCVAHTYEREPLRDNVLQLLDEERAAFGPSEEGEPLTLALTSRWLVERGPAVRSAQARFRAAQARAEIETPWPNPFLTLGPEFGSGSDVDRNEIVPIGSLSFTIPLNGRLARQDDLNSARADAARFDALATLREAYLRLRRSHLELAVVSEQQRLRQELVSAVRVSLEATDSMVKAGQGTALDVSLIRLELARQQSRALAARRGAARVLAAIATVTGVSPLALEKYARPALPESPEEVPELDDLRELILRESPQLLRLRGAHEVAERELHLEVARQYPDITLGAAGGGSSGDRKTVLGLTLGFEIPVFDRNEQAVEEALRKREAARVSYESACHDLLTRVEHAQAVLALERERRRLYDDELLPMARETVDLAHTSVSAGSAGVMEVLDSMRAARQVELEALDAALAEFLAWSELEQAVGYPLIQLEQNPAGAPETLPVALEAEGRGE